MNKSMVVKYFSLFLLLCVLLIPILVRATTFTDDFSGDLSNWTAGPSHLDSYGIIGGELFLDGNGHLQGSQGWGVLQFNEQLGSSFVATWDVRITYYDYACFVLFAGSPWDFNYNLGYANNGYVGWLDINDPTNPLFDVMKMSGGGTLDLPIPQRNISVMPDIPSDQWISYKVEMNSGSLKVYIDGIKYVDTFDPQFATSDYKIGLSLGEDSQGYIDNFQVTTPVPEPISSIKANGSDGPITITSSQSLKLTIALDDGSMTGSNADWWVLCDSPFGWYHYDLSTWVPGIAVTYQGPLFDLGTYQVMDYVLPAGNYTCYFGVDTNMNGSIDMGQIYYDSVIVNVTP